MHYDRGAFAVKAVRTVLLRLAGAAPLLLNVGLLMVSAFAGRMTSFVGWAVSLTVSSLVRLAVMQLVATSERASDWGLTQPDGAAAHYCTHIGVGLFRHGLSPISMLAIGMPDSTYGPFMFGLLGGFVNPPGAPSSSHRAGAPLLSVLIACWMLDLMVRLGADRGLLGDLCMDTTWRAYLLALLGGLAAGLAWAQMWLSVAPRYLLVRGDQALGRAVGGCGRPSGGRQQFKCALYRNGELVRHTTFGAPGARAQHAPAESDEPEDARAVH